MVVEVRSKVLEYAPEVTPKGKLGNVVFPTAMPLF